MEKERVKLSESQERYFLEGNALPVLSSDGNRCYETLTTMGCSCGIASDHFDELEKVKYGLKALAQLFYCNDGSLADFTPEFGTGVSELITAMVDKINPE